MRSKAVAAGRHIAMHDKALRQMQEAGMVTRTPEKLKGGVVRTAVKLGHYPKAAPPDTVRGRHIVIHATIRQKGPEQWHAQVRRTGWPPVTETLRTRKDAETWARDVESRMDRGIFIDRSAAERTTFGETIKTHMKEVTEKRPGEASRAA